MGLWPQKEAHRKKNDPGAFLGAWEVLEIQVNHLLHFIKIQNDN